MRESLQLLAALSSTCTHRAEDGYEMWLRYRPRPSSALRQPWSISTACKGCDSEILQMAVNELRRGLQVTSMQEVPVLEGGGGLVQLRAFREMSPPCGSEGFSITNSDPVSQWTITGTSSGVLYGVFTILSELRQQVEPMVRVCEAPAMPLRIWNLWDNIEGTVERGYAGSSIFWPSALHGEELDRYVDSARLLSSVGINGLVLNNVNACDHANLANLDSRVLQAIASALYQVFRRYAIHLYLSVCFAQPVVLGSLPTYDPMNEEVRQWWALKAAEIYSLMPEFGGFLVKADSEGNGGPLAYGRSQAEGANMLAAALAPYGGIVIWRAFVYGNLQADAPDRARQAFDTFAPLDGQFFRNVVIQIKSGPMDFQVREPISPALVGLEDTNLIMEVQATQEYTGQQVHVVGLASQWESYLSFKYQGASQNASVADLLSQSVGHGRPRITGMAAVSNWGSFQNWTGHILASANTYAFGRLAWDALRTKSANQIHQEWAMLTFDLTNKAYARDSLLKIVSILDESWEIYEQYTSPLGLGFVCEGGYGGGPCDASNTEPSINVEKFEPPGEAETEHYRLAPWQNVGYTNASAYGLGCNRHSGPGGTGYASQYSADVAVTFNSVETCPEELLLFFHHLPWEHVLKSSQKTLIRHLHDTYAVGVARLEDLAQRWRSLEGSGVVDQERLGGVSSRFQESIDAAREWQKTMSGYFTMLSGVPSISQS